MAPRVHGVQTICDPSCLDLHRDISVNIAVTQATGMRFVMATGVYAVAYEHEPVVAALNLDVLADYFVHDLTTGIQGTDICAGFLKVAMDRPGPRPLVVQIHEQAAAASLRTGAPIMAHTNPRAETGLVQLEIFRNAGVDLSRVQLAHSGDTDDLDHLERLLDSGCFIGMDRFAWNDGENLQEDRRLDTVIALLQRGYGGRMMLGTDSAMVVMNMPELRMDIAPHIFTSVIPALIERGAREEQLDAMVGANVGRWLAGAG
jgi:phosphotriesterase-related protein